MSADDNEAEEDYRTVHLNFKQLVRLHPAALKGLVKSLYWLERIHMSEAGECDVDHNALKNRILTDLRPYKIWDDVLLKKAGEWMDEEADNNPPVENWRHIDSWHEKQMRKVEKNMKIKWG